MVCLIFGFFFLCCKTSNFDKNLKEKQSFFSLTLDSMNFSFSLFFVHFFLTFFSVSVVSHHHHNQHHYHHLILASLILHFHWTIAVVLFFTKQANMKIYIYKFCILNDHKSTVSSSISDLKASGCSSRNLLQLIPLLRTYLSPYFLVLPFLSLFHHLSSLKLLKCIIQSSSIPVSTRIIIKIHSLDSFNSPISTFISCQVHLHLTHIFIFDWWKCSKVHFSTWNLFLLNFFLFHQDI